MEKTMPRPGGAKTLAVGDVYKTAFGEKYVYLGYYEGSPHSYYNRPDEGYLYMFYSPLHGVDPEFAGVACDVLDRSAFGIDGNACYCKAPKKFEQKLGHADLSAVLPRLEYVFGLRRLGDKKPRKI